MIKGILNGYYRTGTTIVWWILQKNNPDCIILYEPNSMGVYNELVRCNVDGKTLNKLHGLPIYSPYFKIERELFEEYLKVAEPRSVYGETPEDITSALITLDPFHKSKKELIVQSNQLHLILDTLSKEYGCNYVHICRHPAEVLYSHAESPNRLKELIEKFVVGHFPDVAIKKWAKVGKTGKFEIKACIDHVSPRRYNLTGFLEAYTYYNYIAYLSIKRDEKGMFVRFEDLKDSDVFKKMAAHLGLKVSKIKLDEKRMFQCPDSLKRKVRSVCNKCYLTEIWGEMGYVL